MIDEEKTFEKYGYVSTDLTDGSHKPVAMICDFCGKEFVRIKKESSGKRYCSRECMGSIGEKTAIFGRVVEY